MKRRINVLLLAMVMLINLVTLCPSMTTAAGKPKLNRTSVNITIGKETRLSIKNGIRKAKVKWKSSKKSVAKITKMNSYGNNAYARVRGLKQGKARIYAYYKLGKKQNKYSCIINVSPAKHIFEPTQLPIQVPISQIIQPSMVPETLLPQPTKLLATQTAQPTKAPETPTISPTQIPTKVPETQTPNPSQIPTKVPATQTPKPTLQPTKVPSTQAPHSTENPDEMMWVSAWANAEEKANSDANSMPPISLNSTTYRQVVRVTNGGSKLRLKFSNQYGSTNLVINSTHIAKQIDVTKSDIDVSTDTVVTFNGKSNVVIPPGKVVVSDPVEYNVDALENIAVSTYLGDTPSVITSHRGARATQYILQGNHVSDKVLSQAKTTKSWYYLCDISIMSPKDSAAVVCFGDSITDGYGTDASYLGKKPDSYTRWTDYFAKRLKANAKTAHITVLNEGIGANSMLGSYPTDAGKDRFKRDLLDHDGVKYCIVLFGVNDIGKQNNTNILSRMLTEYKKMVTLCHENNIKIYGAPITPFKGSSYFTVSAESMRESINTWMRSAESGFDGIIDFEKAIADPADPDKILNKYTLSDGLHPYEGYNVMADAIDLSLFE